jgi:hypothetical protein
MDLLKRAYLGDPAGSISDLVSCLRGMSPSRNTLMSLAVLNLVFPTGLRLRVRHDFLSHIYELVLCNL